MMPPLVLEPEVRGEVDEAYAWYERQRLGLGEVFLDEVEAVLEQVRQDPERHAVIDRNVRRPRRRPAKSLGGSASSGTDPTTRVRRQLHPRAMPTLRPASRASWQPSASAASGWSVWTAGSWSW